MTSATPELVDSHCHLDFPEFAAELDAVVARAREGIVTLAKHPKVVGIGEAGLDYYYDKSPHDKQREVFQLHIEAARQTGLPLIVHSRDADEDTAALLREGAAKGGLKGVIHCF